MEGNKMDGMYGSPWTKKYTYPADWRYENDPVFRRLVDMLVLSLQEYAFTGTELREAAILAAMVHESRTIRPMLLSANEALDWGYPLVFGGKPKHVFNITKNAEYPSLTYKICCNCGMSDKYVEAFKADCK